MKKQVSLALLLTLTLLGAALPVQAQAPDVTPLEGLITQVQGAAFLMEDRTLGPVFVQLDAATTQYEGVAAADTLAIGQYVYVQYDGKMTRSQPPQVTALKVSCFRLQGTVSEILETGFLLTGDPVIDQALIRSDADQPAVSLGMSVTVYFSGVMAMSMPPQISAVHIVLPTVEGVASSVSDTGFLLTTADGVLYSVAITPDTQVNAPLVEGIRLTVTLGETLADGLTMAALALTPAPTVPDSLH